MPFLQPTAIFSILIAVSVHEWAHAFVAHRLGDPTPEREGRLTLNPLAHIDPFGAILFLVIGFGWAKPVPINPSYFRHERRDTALVALAGPVSNVILAFLALLILRFLAPDALSASPNDVLKSLADGGGGVGRELVTQICLSSLFINLALMAFNLLPIAPLDGSRVLLSILPRRYEDSLSGFFRHGPMILLALIIAEPILDVPIISLWVYTIVEVVLRGLMVMVGV